jgi:radical SAM protein with 4Fe4S-binding SPASM domain
MLKSITDRALSLTEVFRKKDATLGYAPLEGRFLHLMLDLVERCNLRCAHCAFVHWRDELLDEAMMSEEMIAKLEAEVFPYCHRVSLSCFHEPLMAPNRLVRALEACRRAGVPRPDFITNGLLFSESLARDVMDAGVRRIYFSVDGASKATYDKIRAGGSFDTFVEKVAMVSRLRDALGFDSRRVELAFIACMMRANIHEAPALVDLAADHKIDALELRYLMKSDVAEVDASELLSSIPDEADMWFDRAAARAVERGQGIELMPTRFRDARARAHLVTGPPPYIDCEFPRTSMVISPKGDVYPCCLWHGNDRLDRLTTQPFEKVWNGRALRTLRRELGARAPAHAACLECPVHKDMSHPTYFGPYRFRP